MVSPVLLSLDRLRISVRAVSGRQTTILQDATLGITEGEVVAIVGPSGGGKSTLIKAILGLLPFTDGTLSFRKQVIRRPLDRPHRKLRAVAEAVFQNPMGALNPYATLRRTLAEPLISKARMTATERDALIETTANRMGLNADLLDRRPAEVSLGQAQRACIARALAPKPELLVLDEPLSALDALVAADVAELLTEVIAEYQPTVIFVSHDMRLVRRLASRVIVVDAGKIVEDSSTDHLFDAPRSDAARALVNSDRRRQAAFAIAGQALAPVKMLQRTAP